MPANPIYRLRASDLKTEATIFLVFGLVAFTCKNLFANGFWNTYNSSFDDIKHSYEEQRKFDGVIKIEFDVNDKRGTGYLIDGTSSTAIIYTNDGFIKVNNSEKIKTFKPIRSAIIRKDLQIIFNDISIDSFRILIKNKAIKDLKIQSALPLSYSKDNEPQSSTSVNLNYVLNPVFKSQDLDTIDIDIERQISLTRLQLAEIQSARSDFTARKQIALEELTATKVAIHSTDLAVKEKAIKSLPAIVKNYESMQEHSTLLKPLQVRLNYLNQKLHVKKNQSISGFISYITFK